MARLPRLDLRGIPQHIVQRRTVTYPSRLLKYCSTHPESTIWQYYFLRKSLMFGSRISRRTVKSVNFMARKQYFSSLLGSSDGP